MALVVAFCSLFVVVGEGRQSIFGPELRAAFHYAVAHGPGHYEELRVRAAKVKFLVGVQTELIIGIQVNALPLHFCSDVDVE